MSKKNSLIFIGILLFVLIGIAIIFFSFGKKDKDDILIESDYITILNNSVHSFKSMCLSSDCNIKYKSLDEDIFEVNSEGDIISKNIGVSTLIVSNKKTEKKVTVEIVNNDVMATNINILPEVVKLDKGDEYLLEVTLLPLQAVMENLYWSTSDSDVISVNDGYIKANNDGEAIISVAIDGTNLIDQVKVVVGQGATEEVKSISVDKEVVTMNLNETYQLSPIVFPINAKNKELSYIVSNEAIISVDSNGKITSKRKGETSITILSRNGVSADVDIKVENSSNDLVIADDEVIIAKGELYQLKANYVSGIEWYSNNNKVATVTKNGLVKGISDGETIISIINSYGRINTINVSVKGKGIPVEKIVLDKNELFLRPGSNYKVTAIVSPSNATNKDLIWETSDNRIAVVNDDGVISALRTGEAIITVYSNNFVESIINVKVNSDAISVDSLEINPGNMTMVKGDIFKLSANIIPSNVSNKDIAWTSSDSSIVSVDENGLLMAKKTGNVIITATINGVSNKAFIEVKNNIIDITSLNLEKENIELYVGEKYNLNVSYLPENATNKSFIWQSNNSNVLVSNEGLVTAQKEGNSIVSIKSTNGLSDTINITVKKKKNEVSETPSTPSNPSIPGNNDNSVTDVFINKSNIVLNIGQTEQLRATILPLNAKNNSFTWVSSNEGVVSVSESGLLAAKKPGSAVVSVITSNGKVAKTNITVTYQPIYDSGEKLLELYSDKLIVTMTQDIKTGIKKIRVWVADPYKQFHKVDAQNGNSDTVSNIINNAISTNNLKNTILIGGNSMFTKDSLRIGNMVITEGNNWHYDPGGANGRDEAKNSLIYAGVDSNGKLNVYCTRPENNCIDGKTTIEKEEPLFQSILSDGVRNTIVLPWECLLVSNGKRVDVSWDNRYAIRHTMCQVNTNNFVITISTKGNLKSEHQAIQLNSGCVTGINFDGGGSANSFYKNKGANLVTMIRGTTRPRPDAFYFAEY